jgi:hypothetical protein
MSRPAIAVTHAKTSAVDLVRIAYFDRFNLTSSGTGCPLFSFFTAVVQQGFAGTWSSVYSTGTTPNPNSTAGGFALSMAANESTGDFYVAAAYSTNSAATTQLTYQSAWTGSPWRSIQIVPRIAIVDVATDCVDFRIAVSEVTLGNGSYGPTWYRTGSWTVGNTTPTWVEASGVQVSTLARDPQAILWHQYFTVGVGGRNRYLHALYEEQVGGSYFLDEDIFEASGRPPLPLC